MESRARLLQTGEFARSCLTNERQGRVLASTSKALWLLTDGGRLFWLADAEAPMHRRCCRLAGRVPNTAADARYSVLGNELVIAPHHQVELGRPQVWHAALPARAAPREVIASGLDGLIRALGAAHRKGFAELLPRIFSAADARIAPPDGKIADAMLKRAGPLMLGMIRAGLNGELSGMNEMADGLVGLGPGLTPSGDDFLGGLLFALRTAETALPALRQLSGRIPTERYSAQTHVISFTLLDDLANGYAIAPLHELLNALISGSSPDDVYSHALDLIRVGHSTGWDLLTGLLSGLLIGVGPRQLREPPEWAAKIQV